MSTRTNLRQVPVIGIGSGVSGDMSANITSKPTILNTLTVGSYQFSWTGTSPVGAISIQLSNDYSLDAKGNVSNAGTWTTMYVTLNGSTVVNSIPISGNSGNGMVDWSTGAYAIRAVYTFTSGVGTMLAVLEGKVA